MGPGGAGGGGTRDPVKIVANIFISFIGRFLHRKIRTIIAVTL